VRGVQWSHAAVLVLAGLWLLAVSWRKWPDVIVDFGRELYAPWRLVEGEVLYRDIAWLNGPLSVHWNALWFRVAGVGFGTLVAVNVALVAGFTALLHRVLSRLSYPLAALVGTLFFLFTFAFGATAGYGNYNFVAPYSHEAVHGLVLAIAALAVLDAGERDHGRIRAGASGVLLGLAFLTKPEPFAAGLAGALVALFLGRAGGPESARSGSSLASFASFALGLVLPPLAAWGLLSLAMPAPEVARGVLGAWPAVLEGELARLPYYRSSLGTGFDAPLGNLLAMLAWSAGFAGLLALGLALGRLLPATRRLPGAAVVALVAAIVLASTPISWNDVGHPLPLILLGTGAVLWRARSRSGDPLVRRLLGRRLAFTVFALVLLAKMLLAAKLWHYGFVLAAPASLVVVMALLCWLPPALERRGLAGVTAGALGLGLVAAIGWHCWRVSALTYGLRSQEVGSGSDRILDNPSAAFAVRALAEIERHVPRDGTLLVLPEGIMLDYLSRRRAPTKHLNYMPPETLLYGEGAMLAALEASPPDAVLLVHKDTQEYGFPLFGRDYGASILAWVRARYAEVWTDGDPPLQPGSKFGITLLR
jgi:hypothetical protein